MADTSKENDRLQDILKFVRDRILVRSHARRVAVDATMGNGHDTHFLAENFAKVYAFDIQEAAIVNTRARLQNIASTHDVQLILDSHVNMNHYIEDQVDVFMFNLGWLPGSDKTVTTVKKHTLQALKTALSILAEDGLIALTVYPGHKEGLEEAMAIETWLKTLDSRIYTVLSYAFLNRKNAPYNLLIHRHVLSKHNDSKNK